MPGARAEGHRDGDGAGRLHHERIRLERPPGEDDLVAGVAGRGHDLTEHADAAGARGDVVGGHAQVRGQRLDHRGRRGVGVAVDGLGRLLDHPLHAGQRWVGFSFDDACTS
ncbi:hypothetical protein GCM10025868_24260 [Angustibacter aerolatus]|uniref:Uncharacterized protein n=1 Tax=Angustibacter aerolatus TaxID=1162965 RepID=A0ABQ6JG35_9ACTN|nr:hypothetical protein GCM10025868_24260 [Angustibacter aerolatus]